MNSQLRKQFLIFVFSTYAITNALGQTIPPMPRTTYGDIGILEMPSAHMATDGELGFTGSALEGTQRYTLSFQALPWLEGSFRYSALSRPDGGDPFYDRSFGLRVRIIQESYNLPDVTIGLRDIVGTGVYGSEYIVASKRFGAFDVTTGVGWGRLASVGTFRNPLSLISSSFDDRDETLATPGDVSFGRFLHGEDLGVFGGLIWRTPVDDLALLLEYSSDRYTHPQERILKPRTQINVGLSYHPIDSVNISASWLYGTTFSFALTFATDPTQSPYGTRIGLPAPMPVIRTPEERARAVSALRPIAGTEPTPGGNTEASEASRIALEQRIRMDAAAQLIQVEALSIEEHEVVVYYANSRYQFEPEALGRLSRILMANTPPEVENFRFTSLQVGMPTQDVRFSRSSLERAISFYAGEAEFSSTLDLSAPALSHPVLDMARMGTFPRFSYFISPNFRQSFFDPNQPVQIQLLTLLSGGVELAPGVLVAGAFELNLYDDYRFDRPSDSVLPHVRSDAPLYFRDGINGISSLAAIYRTKLAPEIFVEAKAGYLEGMFAGIGGQALWRPTGKRWALGADLYQVYQREFDRLFGLQDYEVLTGHVSFYYETPWHGLNLDVHAGRYLAKDYGVTFGLTRHFSTGVEVGAFATFTDVPFSQFGEGSFDKGIVIRIPLGWAAPVHSQSIFDLALRPLTRDGGQRLVGDDSLYYQTRRTSYGAFFEHLDKIIRP